MRALVPKEATHAVSSIRKVEKIFSGCCISVISCCVTHFPLFSTSENKIFCSWPYTLPIVQDISCHNKKGHMVAFSFSQDSILMGKNLHWFHGFLTQFLLHSFSSFSTPKQEHTFQREVMINS